jgi:hypothetical protein
MTELMHWLQSGDRDELYFHIRMFSFYVDVFTFWVLCYKYVWNNWTGRKHSLSWPAVGMWAGTFGYALGLGEIVFTEKALVGGIRVWFVPPIVLLWCYIALFKVPLAEERDETEYEKSLREIVEDKDGRDK